MELHGRGRGGGEVVWFIESVSMCQEARGPDKSDPPLMGLDDDDDDGNACAIVALGVEC